MSLYQPYLMHYGVLGMKWGVRRYQNKDGSLTAFGEARLAKRQYKRDRKDHNKNRGQIAKSYAEYQDKKYSAELNSQKKKSKREQKLIEEYKAKGYNQHDAEIQAYKHHKAEKIIAGAAAIAVTAVAAKVAYNHYQEVTDRVLKSGTAYERISANSDKSVKDSFYMMGTKKDRAKYLTLFGAGKNGIKNIKTINVTNDIKVASRKNAKKILGETLNDEKTKKLLINKFDSYSLGYQLFGKGTPAEKVAAKAYADLKAGKITDNVYDAANILLVDKDRKFSSKYYDALRKAGYGAIQDVNDKKYSGFKSKDPLIVFDSAKVTVDSVRQLTTTEIGFSTFELAGKAILKNSAKTAVGIAGMKALGNANKNRKLDKFVENYYKEHPGSKLNRTEVAELYSSSRL